MMNRAQRIDRNGGRVVRDISYPTLIFLLFSVLFGALSIKVVPPLQAPDEIGHFVKTQAFSEFKVRPQKRSAATGQNNQPTWGEYGFKLPYEVQSMNEYANQTRGKNAKPPYQLARKNKRVFIGTGGITNYSFINYLPQLVGTFTGKVLGKSILWQYYAARICNLIVYIGIVFFAIKLFPFSKWGAVLLALNPMALFLASSVSGDGMVIAGSFFFISWMLSLLNRPTISTARMFFSGGMLAALVLMKPTLIVFGMLFFLIPNKALSIKRKLFWGVGILAACLLIYLSWNRLMIDQQLLYRDFADPKGQVSAFLKNPFVFLGNFLGNYLFGVKGDGVLHSFVGNFGWLDTPLGWHWVVLYIVSVVIGALANPEGELTLSISKRLILVAAIVLYVLLTFFALYQIWNQVGRIKSIEGLQGRYFIPGSLLMIPLFSSVEDVLNISPKKINLILTISMLLVLIATVYTLMNRYS